MTQKGITVRKHCIRKPSMVIERFEEMRASFMIEGCGIERKCDIGSMNLIDIAPTLASVMGFDMPQAEGRNRLK